MTEIGDRLWAQIEPTVFITRAEFDRGLADWEIEEFRLDDGQLAFVGLTRGAEYHIASFDTGTPITRSMMRARINAIIERHGFVSTRTPKQGADRQHRFNKAFGFVVAGHDEFFVHYKLEQKCR